MNPQDVPICCVMYDEVQVRHRDKVLTANTVVATMKRRCLFSQRP